MLQLYISVVFVLSENNYQKPVRFPDRVTEDYLQKGTEPERIENPVPASDINAPWHSIVQTNIFMILLAV